MYLVQVNLEMKSIVDHTYPCLFFLNSLKVFKIIKNTLTPKSEVHSLAYSIPF